MDLARLYQIDNFKPTIYQDKAIKSVSGPNLIIAGPGSGKSQVLLLRSLNLLINYEVPSDDIILCTFTEKAANQLKERLSYLLYKVDSNINVHDIKCGTIHNLCNRIIEDNIHISHFKNNYEILDDITQYLFFIDNFDLLLEQLEFGDKYLYRWSIKRKFDAIRNSILYINKICEESIDLNILRQSDDFFLKSLAILYENYFNLLIEKNRIDFSHLQKEAYYILQHPDFSWDFNNIYLMVDEYQDTNHIQESIFLNLTKENKNICVVGDDDQSIYRFRGATVKNILNFEDRFDHVHKFKLEYNFRSNRKIIALYNHFIQNIDWNDNSGNLLRLEKNITTGSKAQDLDYPSTLSVKSDPLLEPEIIAKFVNKIHKEKIIEDYSDVAILLKSVQSKYSDPYIEAFQKLNIKVFCPRARGFFLRTEISLFFGSFYLIFNYPEYSIKNSDLEDYLNASSSLFTEQIKNNVGDKYIFDQIYKNIRNSYEVIYRDILELFYEIISLDIFQNLLQDQNVAYNIGQLSNLIQKFQSYYDYIPFYKSKLSSFPYHFFSSFLNFLFSFGVNEYEDSEDLLPKGYIQLMTIHQAKGLEFPVVIVGTLSNKFTGTHVVDNDLLPFYERNTDEPISSYNLYDNVRLFYVAFSRAMNLLILLGSKNPNKHFGDILYYTLNLEETNIYELIDVHFKINKRTKLKKKLSITGDILLYETCPKQYEIFRDYNFSPSSTAQFTVGILVHNTIEQIHRNILFDDSFNPTLDDVLRTFEENLSILKMMNQVVIGSYLIDNARKNIINYYNNFRSYFKDIIDFEKLIVVEKDKFYLVGRIDAVVKNNDGIMLLDFKAQQRPDSLNSDIIDKYKNQLSIYIHQLNTKGGIVPNRNVLFFTGESEKNRAFLDLEISENDVTTAIGSFDSTAVKILSKDYLLSQFPDFDSICSQCDYRKVCFKNGNHS